MASGWTSTRIEDVEPITVAGGLLWRPLRRALGVQAFGVNAYVAPAAGDHVVERHTESSLQHEEIYVVLSGRATFEIGGETVDAPAGTVVFVSDPSLERHAVAAEADTAVLAVGGRPGDAYTPSVWETHFLAERHRATGDFDTMADELEAALVDHPDDGALLYNLACAEAQCGRLDGARTHLDRALELRPDLRDWSQADDDLAPLRDTA